MNARLDEHGKSFMSQNYNSAIYRSILYTVQYAQRVEAYSQKKIELQEKILMASDELSKLLGISEIFAERILCLIGKKHLDKKRKTVYNV